MFSLRKRIAGGLGAVEVAFTDRTLDLSLPPGGELDRLARALAEPTGVVDGADGAGAEWSVAGLEQVHGASVHVIDAHWSGELLVGDGLVTSLPGVALMVRAADCVPVLLADPDAGVVGAAHCGRPGLVAGVVPATVAAMRDLGADRIRGWLGPHVCGRCYEVPAEMRAEVCAAVPGAWGETSWGTPSVDLTAGVTEQLRALGIGVQDAKLCTLEHDDLWSYRRDGAAAGRMAGVVGLAATAAAAEAVEAPAVDVPAVDVPVGEGDR